MAILNMIDLENIRNDEGEITYKGESFKDLRDAFLHLLSDQSNQESNQESCHIYADDLICLVALNDILTFTERTELVDLYDQIHKWFS